VDWKKSGAIAHNLGLKVAMGAWVSEDNATNEKEINNLISSAKANDADMLIVGSEVLLRGDLPEETLIDYINRVKQEAHEIPVSYSDVYAILLSHPNIIDAVDVILVNYYPYWEGIGIDQAIPSIEEWHEEIKEVSNGKQIILQMLFDLFNRGQVIAVTVRALIR
jgi:GPH family glycoside/pentoside/hexuronide:cation symporter